MAKSPAVIPFSTDSVELAVKDATAVPTDARGQIIVGLDGSTTRFVNVDSSGRVLVSSPQLPATLVGGRLDTNLGAWLGSTVPTVGQKIMASSIPVVFSSDQSSLAVTVASLPLPSGAATEASLVKLNVPLGTALGSNTQALVGASVTTAAPTYTTGQINPLSLTVAGGLRVDGSGVTQPVSAASLPLPSGAATETTLAAINTKTLAAGQAVMAASSPVVIASDQTAIPITDNAGSITVDGTVTANQGTAAALAGRWPVIVTDGTNTMPTGDVVGRAIFEKITDGTNTAAVKAASTAAVAADPALVVAISPNNSVAITAASLPLPAGAATETTLGTRLADSTFTARINTLGQKTMANSTPFVIASDQSEVASKNAVSSQVDGHSVSIGATTDADTANTVIGRLKQIITKLAGGLPAALIGGRLDSNIGAWLGSTAPTVGQKTGAASIPTVAASDQWPDALARSIFVKRTDGTNVAPTGDVVARSIFQQLSDGTTGPVAVKPASTQPVVGDKALVVVLSPNQAAIPTTTAPLNSTPLLSMGDVALSSVTTVAIRRTAYTEQSANFTGSVSSNNAADSAAGAGMRTARITWMDSTGVTVGTEDVAFNGTTPVNLVTATKCFIDKIEGLTWGANGTNTGIISLFTGAAGAGTVVGTIAATDNRTFWAHHYVQSGKIGNVTSVFHGNNSTVSGGTSVAVLRKRTIVANSGEVQISDFIRISGAVNSLPRNYGSVVQVVGPARIAMYVTTSSSASIVYTGSFDSYDA